jgi:hypothetical protein
MVLLPVTHARRRRPSPQASIDDYRIGDPPPPLADNELKKHICNEIGKLSEQGSNLQDNFLKQ